MQVTIDLMNLDGCGGLRDVDSNDVREMIGAVEAAKVRAEIVYLTVREKEGLDTILGILKEILSQVQRKESKITEEVCSYCGEQGHWRPDCKLLRESVRGAGELAREILNEC